MDRFLLCGIVDRQDKCEGASETAQNVSIARFARLSSTVSLELNVARNLSPSEMVSRDRYSTSADHRLKDWQESAGSTKN
jgi:hypothetical protein